VEQEASPRSKACGAAKEARCVQKAEFKPDPVPVPGGCCDPHFALKPVSRHGFESLFCRTHACDSQSILALVRTRALTPTNPTACAPQLSTPSLFPACPCGEITRSRSPLQWNTHDANLPAPIWRVRAHPPPIDGGIRTSGLPQLPPADPVRQGPTCYAVYPGCNVRSTISK